MQKRLIELSEQRGRLRERIAHQRRGLARDILPLMAPLSLPARLADAARQGRDFLMDHPYLMGTIALSLLVLKPRFVMRWAQRGLLVGGGLLAFVGALLALGLRMRHLRH